MSERQAQIVDLIANSTMTYKEIAEYVQQGASKKIVGTLARNFFDKEFLLVRAKHNWGQAKLGVKNPMFGKTKDQHHNYKGKVEDGKGYQMILKPEWFSSRSGSKHVFYHHVVICEKLGLTGIPKGYVVHHIDHNPLNNSPDNLELMTMADHTRLHCALRRATTISKESRGETSEAVGTTSDECS